MSLRRHLSPTRAVAALGLTAAVITSALLTVAAGHASAADADPGQPVGILQPTDGQRPENPTTKAVLDLVWQTPEDDYSYSDQERIEGIAGLNDFPGGPFGAFPAPADPTRPDQPRSPGDGLPATVTALTGINPRQPGR